MSASKHLYLMRHAKSSWDDPALADRDRPLSARGWRACRLISDHLHHHQILPELILCSTARRTVQTLHAIYPQHDPEGPWSYPHGQVRFEQALYGASAAEILARVQTVADGIESVMVIGHNPALQILALALADAGPGSDPDAESDEDGEPDAGDEERGEDAGAWLAQIRRKLPTGSLVSFEFQGEWSSLTHRRAQLTGYVRPKTLAD